VSEQGTRKKNLLDVNQEAGTSLPETFNFFVAAGELAALRRGN